MSQKRHWRTEARNLTRAIERGAPIDWGKMCERNASVVLANEPLGRGGSIVIHGGRLTLSRPKPSEWGGGEISRTQVGVTWRNGSDESLYLSGAILDALFPTLGDDTSRAPRWELYVEDGIDYHYRTAAQEPVGQPYIATIGINNPIREVYVNVATPDGLKPLRLMQTPIPPERLVVLESQMSFTSSAMRQFWETIKEGE